MFKKLFKGFKKSVGLTVVKAATVLADESASDKDRRDAGTFLEEASDKFDDYEDEEKIEVARAAWAKLNHVIENAEPWVCHYALLGMTEISNVHRYDIDGDELERSLDRAISLMGHDDESVRAGAAKLIGSLPNVIDDSQTERALKVLAEHMKDPSGDARAAAVSGLTSFVDKADAYLPAIIASMDDSEEWARCAAVSAFTFLDVPPDLQQQVLATLIKRLQDDPSRSVRGSAADAIGSMGQGNFTALDALISALNDSERRVRHFTLYAISEFGSEAEAAVPHLERFLDDDEHQDTAVMTLSEIGTDQAMEMLSKRGLSADD